MNPLYSVSVCGGLEKIARDEIQTRLNDKGKVQIVAQKPKRILLRYSGGVRDLFSLRAVEHVFLVVRRFSNITRSRQALTMMRKSLGQLDFRPYFALCQSAGLRLRKQVTFRVTSHLSGQRNFRRIDLQRAVEQGLTNYGWRRIADKNPALDVWVEVHGDDAYISIRLSPLNMAQRDYKQAHIPTSLKPTVAYSLVQLSDPRPDDIFLDAMCGAGTILIERAYSGRYRYLLGGDISTEALHAAQTNIGRKHRPRQLFHWDAQLLPLADWSVDKIVCSPPFAGQRDDKFVDRILYRQFLIECERVLKPTGRMVLLTTHGSEFENLLKQRRSFQIVQKLKINLRGQNPWVYLCLPH